MGDGWTGVDLNQARADLDRFHNMVKELDMYANDAISTFSDVLAENWFSYTAAHSTIIGTLSTIGGFIDGIDKTIIEKAVSAIQTLASSNGATFMYEPEGLVRGAHPIYVTEHGFGGAAFDVSNHCKETGPNGEMGMNKAKVSVGLNELTQKINSVCNNLDNLPTNIALYDPSGDLANAFKTAITKGVQYSKEALARATKYVETDMNNEFDTISLGVLRAKEALDQTQSSEASIQNLEAKINGGTNQSATGGETTFDWSQLGEVKGVKRTMPDDLGYSEYVKEREAAQQEFEAAQKEAIDKVNEILY